jgi:hypothetical protein
MHLSFLTIRLFCKFSSNLKFLWNFAIEFEILFPFWLGDLFDVNYCLICGSSKAVLLSGCGKCEMRLNDNMVVFPVCFSPLLYEIRICKKGYHHIIALSTLENITTNHIWLAISIFPSTPKKTKIMKSNITHIVSLNDHICTLMLMITCTQLFTETNFSLSNSFETTYVYS